MHKKLAVNLQIFWALTLNCQTSFKVFDVPGFVVNSSYKQEWSWMIWHIFSRQCKGRCKKQARCWRITSSSIEQTMPNVYEALCIGTNSWTYFRVYISAANVHIFYTLNKRLDGLVELCRVSPFLHQQTNVICISALLRWTADMVANCYNKHNNFLKKILNVTNATQSHVMIDKSLALQCIM
jgi:hypothetical protein